MIIVKIGGGAGLDLARCVHDLAVVSRETPLVIVHGVSAVMNALCESRGIPVRTITSPTGHASRYTDPVTRDLFVEAAESVNRDVVTYFGSTAYGVTGEQVALFGERKAAIRALVDGRICIIRDDYSGTITGIDADNLRGLLSEGFVPVLPPLAQSPDGLLNVDGDRAAAAVASALNADQLIILSNVRGLYRNPADDGTLMRTVHERDMSEALNAAAGRMKRKVIAAGEALSGRVGRVVIADGRIENPVTAALAGHGTVFGG